MNNPIYEMILALREPNRTPEFQRAHEAIQLAHRNGALDDKMLNSICTDPECIVCAQIVCPYHEAFHFHHDGCPACSTGRFTKSNTKNGRA